MIKTRFAPSPTGFLHIGGLRTALYGYLVAKKNGGKFILRIEDTDQKRSVADGTQNILRSLYWAGIIPDEGVVLNKDGKIIQKGKDGPYIQSQRLEIYKKYAEELLKNNHAYYCFCAPERLAEVRDCQQKNRLPSVYDGHCRNLDCREARNRVKKGERHVMRMKIPKEGETVFKDLIRGEVRFKNELIDDQVLIKSDGFPTYHLAVVVDDHLMRINPVIRGEEWLSSAPKHIQLYKYFGWEVPKMAHIPLLFNPDKSKLSKRQGDVAVEDYSKRGYLPEAVVNFVAFLGWNPGGGRELFDMKELIKEFDLLKVNKSGAVFNLEKLDWYNKQYIKKLSNAELVKVARPWLKSLASSSKIDDKKLIKAVALERERITVLSELPEAIKFIFDMPNYQPGLLIWKKSTLEETKKILPKLAELLDNFSVREWKKENIDSRVGEWIRKSGYTNGSVLWPLRVALAGQEKSPGPFEIAEVLGKEESLVRIKTALKKLQ